MIRSTVINNSVEAEEKIYDEYRHHHSNLFENNIVNCFFQNRQHSYLFGQFLIHPTIENKNKLEQAFKRFFFCIRFTKYLSSLIKYSQIDFHRKRKKVEERNPLVFDVPLGEESEVTFGEYLFGLTTQIEWESPLRDPVKFHETIEDNHLYWAFAQLTEKQRAVITLAYSACVMDTEIACAMRVSQQAITKIRMVALQKMRKNLQEQIGRKEGDNCG